MTDLFYKIVAIIGVILVEKYFRVFAFNYFSKLLNTICNILVNLSQRDLQQRDLQQRNSSKKPIYPEWLKSRSKNTQKVSKLVDSHKSSFNQIPTESRESLYLELPNDEITWDELIKHENNFLSSIAKYHKKQLKIQSGVYLLFILSQMLKRLQKIRKNIANKSLAKKRVNITRKKKSIHTSESQQLNQIELNKLFAEKERKTAKKLPSKSSKSRTGGKKNKSISPYKSPSDLSNKNFTYRDKVLLNQYAQQLLEAEKCREERERKNKIPDRIKEKIAMLELQKQTKKENSYEFIYDFHSDSNSDSDSDTDSDSDSDTNSESDTKTNSNSDSDMKTNSNTDSDTKKS